MDKLIEDLNSQKTGEKYHDFVITDAISYIEKAKECMAEGMADPLKWYCDAIIMSKTISYLFPQIYTLQQLQIPPETDKWTSENSQPSD